MEGEDKARTETLYSSHIAETIFSLEPEDFLRNKLDQDKHVFARYFAMCLPYDHYITDPSIVAPTGNRIFGTVGVPAFYIEGQVTARGFIRTVRYALERLRGYVPVKTGHVVDHIGIDGNYLRQNGKTPHEEPPKQLTHLTNRDYLALWESLPAIVNLAIGDIEWRKKIRDEWEHAYSEVEQRLKVEREESQLPATPSKASQMARSSV